MIVCAGERSYVPLLMTGKAFEVTVGVDGRSKVVTLRSLAMENRWPGAAMTESVAPQTLASNRLVAGGTYCRSRRNPTAGGFKSGVFRCVVARFGRVVQIRYLFDLLPPNAYPLPITSRRPFYPIIEIPLAKSNPDRGGDPLRLATTLAGEVVVAGCRKPGQVGIGGGRLLRSWFVVRGWDSKASALVSFLCSQLVMFLAWILSLGGVSDWRRDICPLIIRGFVQNPKNRYGREKEGSIGLKQSAGLPAKEVPQKKLRDVGGSTTLLRRQRGPTQLLSSAVLLAAS